MDKTSEVKKNTETKDIEKRDLTPEEQQRLDRYLQRSDNQPTKFKIREKDKKGRLVMQGVDFNHPMSTVKLSEALGTIDCDLINHLLNQVQLSFAGITSAKEIDTNKCLDAANTALAILHGIQPRDELEGMLAVQMIGVHNMAMECIGKATRTDRVVFINTYMNGATKMLRTFAAQMEALKRYRTGGQQKMTVEHVHVNKGGQAIVGTVNQGGGGPEK